MGEKLNYLVIGAGRGGTSLLTTCLDAHPLMDVGEELFTAEYLGGGVIDDRRYRYDMRYRVSRFFEACDMRARKVVQPISGNKILTENIFWLQDCLPTMQQHPLHHVRYFFNQVPGNVRIVFIIRDGRNIIASKVKRTQQPISHALFRYKHLMFVLRYLKEHYTSLLVLRFEDLVCEPEKELRSVCDYLGVVFDSAMLTTQGKTMPSYYAKSYFDKSKAETIAEIPDMYLPIIKDDLTFCGYS